MIKKKAFELNRSQIGLVFDIRSKLVHYMASFPLYNSLTSIDLCGSLSCKIQHNTNAFMEKKSLSSVDENTKQFVMNKKFGA